MRYEYDSWGDAYDTVQGVIKDCCKQLGVDLEESKFEILSYYMHAAYCVIARMREEAETRYEFEQLKKQGVVYGLCDAGFGAINLKGHTIYAGVDIVGAFEGKEVSTAEASNGTII